MPNRRRTRPVAAAGPDRSRDGASPARRISLPFDIFALNTRLGAYLDRALAGTGVRPAEYAVYSLMLEAGPRTPTELAAMLGAPPTTLSTYLSAMLARGDARKIPNPADGRSVRVVLTDRGRAVVRRVNPAFTRADEALEANLDRPVEEVQAVLAAIAEALEGAATELEASDSSE